MRFFILIVAIFMIPAFAVVMEWRFQTTQRSDLLSLCRSRVAKAGLNDVSMTLDHFDAHVSGLCADPADRDKARTAIISVRGVRLKDEDNGIRVPAKLTANILDQQMRVSGWLPAERLKADIVRFVKEARPDLDVSGNDIRVSSFVDLGPNAETLEGSLPKVFVTLLESVRLPASLSIHGDGHTYIFKGSLPSPALRDAIISAAKQSAPFIQIDAAGLVAQEHVMRAPFAEGSALANFVRVYFESPTPGDFQIDQRNGPRLKAYATAAMESSWLTALRAVSGAAHVTSDLTLLPSLYHFPTYQPETKLERAAMDGLRETLHSQMVYFDSGSSKVKTGEESALENLAQTIKNAGPSLHLIVAGYADVGGEPGAGGKGLQRSRAEAVRAKLIDLGIAADILEAMPFDAVRPPGQLTDQVRHDTRCVELLIK